MDARVAASGKGFWRLAVIVSPRARLKGGTTLTDGACGVQQARQQATR